MSYTVDQVREAIYDPNAYNGGWGDLMWADRDIVIDGESVDYEVVDTSGGMDAGSNASVTIKIGDQYFRKEGYYASHDGYYWDGDFSEVKPVEKTVVVYETF